MGIETDGETRVTARTAELAANLTTLTERIDAACRVAGREPDTVRLLPVTKFFPASDIEILYGLGRREFGESREQEASEKVAQLRHLSHVRWEFIGRLQRNKAKHVARWANTVYSVDSDRLATALDTAVTSALEAGDRDTPLRVLLQVSLDADPTRGGVAPDDLPALADRIEESASLQLAGLMAIPPLGTDPAAEFARLADLHGRLLATHPQARELSAGMSNDLEAAIAHGSTCVRVGTALMGARPITSP
ncbi:YggS family pyridoxal phosphate-dependent enzyme [Nocardia otitidiscaviarum]|uniref:YggS family pyridoxal phosphate-dependent enzyme n=1 Tax=Nocardia otitidiscaviarum TaxID=1823 RepID=UPI0006948484|nr:YggS family pyridoxal phosphate-dependent enzyme [Nocardia otitidiscaviarum]MBF6134562.1 YggS family pyridoxal phosphate-dependent enzyme [Nocardia otitidiscaviarum]MBF6485812.1 YggS family pyridoxal phosphate-dependent enzyme [Nocardia otitidiscaviarum]